MKRRGQPTGRPTPRQHAWWSSAGFREIGRQTCKRINARRSEAVKCGATKKSDGEPCQNLPLANGRCRLHGGATPSGKDWHVPRYPESDTAARAAKSDRKAADVAKRARKLAKRLAAMTPEERARYNAWHQSHALGTKGQRQAAKRQAIQNAETRALIATMYEPAPMTVEAKRLQSLIERTERYLAQIERAAVTKEWDVFS